MTTNTSCFMCVLIIAFFAILILPAGLYSQVKNEDNIQNHEITIFVIPALSHINWSNPSMLYKSMQNCFIKSIIKKNYYTIGHTIARISSPLIQTPCFVAMHGAVTTEKAELVLVKKIGLGAMGSSIQGCMETEESIKRGIEMYSKRNKVAYIKFIINEQAVCRILEFIELYQRKSNNNFKPCNFYNGATWPRYQNEGSGCSAFGMALLDVANVLPVQSNEWRVNLKLPMNLIGGEFNNNKKIKFGSIRRAKSWYQGTGIPDVDYVNLNIYDPSLIFDWIQKFRGQHNTEFLNDNENGIPGLIVDRHNVIFDVNDPIFLHRTDSNLFVKHYYIKIRALISK